MVGKVRVVQVEHVGELLLAKIRADGRGRVNHQACFLYIIHCAVPRHKPVNRKTRFLEFHQHREGRLVDVVHIPRQLGLINVTRLGQTPGAAIAFFCKNFKPAANRHRKTLLKCILFFDFYTL